MHSDFWFPKNANHVKVKPEVINLMQKLRSAELAYLLLIKLISLFNAIVFLG
jgi:hypothetical protein